MWEYRVTVRLPDVSLPPVSKRYRTLAKAIKNITMIVDHPSVLCPVVELERVLVTAPGA
jgi:hypothetical protein